MDKNAVDEFLANAGAAIEKAKNKSLPGGDKINIYIFGQRDQNLLKLLLEIFSAALKNGVDGFFVRGCECTLSYGAEEKLYIEEASGKRETDFSEMTSLLSQLDDAGRLLKFEAVVNNRLLEEADVHIVISDDEYAGIEWSEVLKEADYIFFSLSATALLSMNERKILRTHLLANMENGLGILLTNNNMILTEDRELIDASVAKVLGAYEVPVFKFPDEDEEKFAQYVKLLSERRGTLREMNFNRNKKITLGELLHDVDVQLDVLSADNARADDVIELLNEKLQKLPERKETAFRRARMKYTSKLKIELSEEASLFHRQFDETLEKEIEANDDVEELQRILPDYISAQWENEVADMDARVKEFTENVTASLKEYINDDITSYIKEDISEDFAEYVFGLTKMYLREKPIGADTAMHTKGFDFEAKKDNTKLKKYGAVASGVALVLMSHPFVGIAVAVFGSKKIAEESEKRFVTTSKQALVGASKKLCIDFHTEADLWIDRITENLEAYLEECIGECYQSVIDFMIDAVKEKQRDFKDYDDEIERLKKFKSSIEEELK